MLPDAAFGNLEKGIEDLPVDKELQGIDQGTGGVVSPTPIGIVNEAAESGPVSFSFNNWFNSQCQILVICRLEV